MATKAVVEEVTDSTFPEHGKRERRHLLLHEPFSKYYFKIVSSELFRYFRLYWKALSMISSYRREKLDHEESRAAYDVDVVHSVKHLTNPYVMCASLIEHNIHDYHYFNIMSPMTIKRRQKNTSLAS